MHERHHHAQDSEEDEPIYKDVVIVGNGPSGICLSYMLAGNWPYYSGEPHPGDEMLTARLHVNDNDVNNEGKNDDDERVNEKGLACTSRWGLELLSTGLEGRGEGRPLALLMDSLQHPCTDAGLDLPSLLTWRPPSPAGRYKHRIIDHVVLGKGPPGGAWQAMDPNVLTISLGRWMSLPGLDLRNWEMLVEREHMRSSTACDHHVSADLHQMTVQEKPSTCRGLSRVPVGTVAMYYKDYVRRQGLDKYFRCGTKVTSIRPLKERRDGENTEEPEWLVEGFDIESRRRFRYRSRRVVLATGSTDLCNQLGLPGENSNVRWLTHDLNDLEARLDRIAAEQNEQGTVAEPVLIVGAGLSAADAVMAARFRGIPVLHVFRNHKGKGAGYWSNDSNKIDEDGDSDVIESGSSASSRLQWLPVSMYPEYHKVYEMMADGGTNYPLYKALRGYTLVDLGTDPVVDPDQSAKKVTLRSSDGQLESYHVSVAAVLIGSRPDLSYLQEETSRLGKDPTRPVDGRSNPIEVDEFTYEVLRAPSEGLYALGPLVGENFVRFILGGAFGVLTHILNTSSASGAER